MNLVIWRLPMMMVQELFLLHKKTVPRRLILLCKKVYTILPDQDSQEQRPDEELDGCGVQVVAFPTAGPGSRCHVRCAVVNPFQHAWVQWLHEEYLPGDTNNKLSELRS